MNFSDVRAKYPQYDDLSDDDLAGALHKKFYSDMSYQDFSQKVGLRPAVDQSIMDPRDAQAKSPAQATGMQKFMASAPGRFVRGGLDVVDAGAQMLSRLGGPEESARVDSMNRERSQLFDQANKAAGFEGMDIARPLGSAALQMTALRGLPVGATMPAKIGMGAAQGATFGALQPVNENQDQFWTEKAKQAGVGAATGAIAAPVAEGISRVIRPSVDPAVKALKDAGVRLTPGQIMGGGFKTAEEKAQSLPIVGQAITAAKQRGVEDLNRAAFERALTPIGEKLPKGVIGNDAVAYTSEKLSAAYSTVLGKIGRVSVDTPLRDDFNKIGQSIANLPKDKQAQFISVLKNEIASRVDDGVISAESLKAAESNLGELARGYARSSDYDQRMLGKAIERSQTALRKMVERQSPENAETLKAINKGWANFKRPQRAAASVAAEEGVFTPAQLHNAVKAADRSKDKARFASGEALMQDLSAPAKRVMQDQTRNSGTTDRLLTAGYLGSLLSHPISTIATSAATLPALAAYSRPGVAAMEGLLTSRPQVAQPLSELMRRSSPLLGAPLYPGAYGLLNSGP